MSPGSYESPFSLTETRKSPALRPLTLIPISPGSTTASLRTVPCQIANMNGTSRSATSPDRPCARPVPCRMSQEWTP